MALEADLQKEVDELKTFVDPAQAGQLQELFEKNAKAAQALKDRGLRQSDYSRFLNENKQNLEYAAKMKKWADENVPKHEKLTHDFAELETLNRTLETQVTDYRDQLAKAAAGGDVDEATLDARVEKRLKDLGYATKSETEAIIKQEAKKLADESANTAVTERTNKFLTETWPAATEIMSELIEVSFEHMQEMGKPLTRDDRKAIGDLMKERGIQDPRKAYEAWVEPKRNEKKFEVEVEKRVTERLSKEGFPGVSGSPTLELGPVQLKNAGKIPELPADSKLGDNNAAIAAGAELRSEGKW